MSRVPVHSVSDVEPSGHETFMFDVCTYDYTHEDDNNALVLTTVTGEVMHS